MVLLIRETLVFYGNWCWFASKKSLKIPMGQSEPVNRRKDNAMVKRYERDNQNP
jgi:hypothetical protein